MPKTVTAKPLIEAQYAASSATTHYTVPTNTKTIIDKFTVVNTDSSARTLTVYFVPNGESVGAEYTVCNAESVSNTAHALEITELKGHILNSGDVIAVLGSVADKLVIRCSGREVLQS